jgi:hypothetical protein
MTTQAGMELIGALVSQNVADAAFTTNLLLEANDREIQSLAQTVTMIAEILDQATVIDRATEHRLAAIGYRIDSAYRVLDKAQS